MLLFNDVFLILKFFVIFMFAVCIIENKVLKSSQFPEVNIFKEDIWTVF